jgi:hypothetical protein
MSLNLFFLFQTERQFYDVAMSVILNQIPEHKHYAARRQLPPTRNSVALEPEGS